MLHILLTLTVDNVPLLQWSEVRNTVTDHLIDGPAGSDTRTAKAEVRNTVTDHLTDGPAGSETRTAKAEVRNTVTDHLIDGPAGSDRHEQQKLLSLIHISEPTRPP